MSTKRIETLRRQLKAENLDGMIVTHGDYVRYLTGYTGSNGLLVVGPRTADFLTDFRYADQSRKQVQGARIHVVNGDLLGSLKDFSSLVRKNDRIGVDGDHMSMSEFNKLRHIWPDVLLPRAESVLAELGWVKEKVELDHIKAAVKISDTAFDRILSLVAPGLTERDVAAELEYQMSMLGSERPAFETIVASGARSALPHGIASDKVIKKGDFITFDFGATVNGYVSDMTRTIVVGKATKRQQRIYGIVLKAQEAGLKKVKAGVTGKAVDAACRKIITRAGFGKNFGHGTGHGIGYYVHVGPRLSALSPDVLQPNNVVTVEPGIYISGWGGVRIEDDVVVTRSGGTVLNKAPKKLLEV